MPEKLHCIRYRRATDLCKGSGGILGYYFDVLRKVQERIIMNLKSISCSVTI